MSAKQRHYLNTGWKWRLANSNGASIPAEASSIKEWNPVKRFPSVIQMELLDNKLIPNPNIGLNERVIQWAGEVDWEYATTFLTPEAQEVTELVFDGLDTYATVRLNGKEILRSENMFLPQRVNVKYLLKTEGQENELSIVFDSAIKIANGLEVKFGARTSWMRDKRRMHLRKVQCHWGWDWGPKILTAGPWLPVYLESYVARLDNIHVSSDLADDHSSATVTVEMQGSRNSVSKMAKVTIFDMNGSEIASSKVLLDESAKASEKLPVACPKLWWPNGQGSQHLYTAKVELLDGSSSSPMDDMSSRFGIRTIKLIQRPLTGADGETFMFSVNGRDIFCQGGNWIPADNLQPTMTRERYNDWMRLARYSNLNMIRVWGGGIYETEEFFDACDEFGMLVWHDWAFACGNYPIHQEFLDSVKAEVEAQTIRLRNRASLALICGGNEDFFLNDMFGVKYDYADVTGPFDDTDFPQRKIYLQLLPEISKRLAPKIQYWPSSPWGGRSANDTTGGDIHQWAVWHEGKPYQNYKNLAGRFVSEFGMHGFPINRTMDVFAPDPQDRHPQSRAIDCHNKGTGAETRIARYLAENFRYDMRLENFAYCSQLLQSEAYGYALRDWKRLFKGRGQEECAGAVIWQLNDIYPCTSWAYIDYYKRPKPAFYTIRREFAPLSIGVERTPRSRWVDEDHPLESFRPKFQIFAHNTTARQVEAVLELKAYDLLTGEWTDAGPDARRDVSLTAGYNTELGVLEPQDSWTEESLIVLEARLVDRETEKPLARMVNWPEPFRYLHWPADTNVTVSVQKAVDDTIVGDVQFEDVVTVMANHPVKGLWLEPVYNRTEEESEPEPLWQDNMLDLMPGREIKVLVKGLRGRPVKVKFLGDWEL
ncbi:hypothetical protein LTR99_006149 [Exophiala xenobiotica]|uniref:Beta-mannosidase B n=1 Tax=Vermiconidia calcicola TaxID=1690605 RepID=A0AAV9QBT8_9PEZI|nr:hypothetical protein LTR92_010317 [Exophiala xenobiotica]KAK5533094.1 hypothetical protein LTR23_009391 [Chaetothyriales sp. CCFEE 6169]KAK5537321.1 hypothetical protein LTR25_004572 [Vermiconidia calcicola]KAK5217147.1 hypothetical protein LTR72_009713 [Exophiala xenobiotica]KAK5244579.1 hypothetical protein LTS06_009877 [Exophiala xenobiotica]